MRHERNVGGPERTNNVLVRSGAKTPAKITTPCCSFDFTNNVLGKPGGRQATRGLTRRGLLILGMMVRDSEVASVDPLLVPLSTRSERSFERLSP